MSSASPSTSPRATSGWWVVPRQVVQRRAVLSPEPHRSSKPARCYQQHPRAAPLEQRVSRDRRAVDQDVDRSRQSSIARNISHRRDRAGVVTTLRTAISPLSASATRSVKCTTSTPIPHRHCPTQFGLRIADCGLSGSAPSRTTSPANPQSEIRNPHFHARASISSVAPPTRRRTPVWPALPASPPVAERT